MKKLILITTILLLLTTVGFADNAELKSYNEEYYDFLVLIGKADRPYLQYRSLSTNTYSNSNGFWSDKDLGDGYNNSFLKLYLPEIKTTFNSKRPYGQNDTGLWQGVGFNVQAKAGLSFNSQYFSATFKPEINFSQNKEYKTFKDLYSYYWYGLDLPQRFGNSSFSKCNLGDSEIRFKFKTFTIAAGTQSRWVGNNYLNAVLLSNNAEPFPYLEIGLNKTNVTVFKTNLGNVEGHYSIGFLQNSSYTPNIGESHDDEKSLLHVFSLAYAPSWINGLSVGINATGHTGYSWEDFLSYFKVLTREIENGTHEDSKFSITADWLLPSVGFEIYGEYGVDDYVSNTVRNFFHSAVYQVGFKKSINIAPQKNIYGVLNAEFGVMDSSKDSFTQWQYNFYGHNVVRDGLWHSHKGQLLGAGTGYAGTSLYIGFTTLYKKGLTTVFFQRSNPDKDYVYLKLNSNNENHAEFTDYTNTFKTNYDFGIKTTFFTGYGFNLNAAFVYNLITNEYYGETSDIKKETTNNLHFELGVKTTF